ncbi:hypothetical protein [Halosolutus gelatinilyticus]|uniref:hypothetical protein n=1 Tax=Halosolutus gelatinilyticus TaxID=2931975 RepID=UPI001FF6980A|nr:hypothetical protein [Halosolutus gelatinilyticus]
MSRQIAERFRTAGPRRDLVGRGHTLSDGNPFGAKSAELERCEAVWIGTVQLVVTPIDIVPVG